jgi:phosphinothricin acetyltransferase
MAISSAARTAGFRQLIAVIGDSDNEASIGLHTACGFERAGLLKQIGEKFGKPLDIVMMQRSLIG